MNRKIKLLWDFRGPDSGETARHHALHLSEFIKRENLSLQLSGHETITKMHAVAYMVVDESMMIQIRDALLPHRGEVYVENPG